MAKGALGRALHRVGAEAGGAACLQNSALAGLVSWSDRTMRTGVTSLWLFAGIACGDNAVVHPKGKLKDAGSHHEAGPTWDVLDGSDQGPVDAGEFEAGLDAAAHDAASSAPDAGGPRDAGEELDLDAGEQEAPRFAQVYEEVISTHCAFCHHPDADGDGGDSAMIGYTLGHLDMHDVDAAYENLVGDGGGALAAGIHCGPLASDAGYRRVIPGDYAHSVIYTKVTVPVCGVRMPDGLPPLDDAGIELIRAWIQGGAK